MDCIVSGHPISEEWKALERKFIRNQSQLRSLELQVCLRVLDFTLDQFLPPCHDTLERFELTTSNMTPNFFSCSSLANFTKLKQCHLYMRDPDVSLDFAYNSGKAEIMDVCMLPPTITNLHLPTVIKLEQVPVLRKRLVNLKQISYVGNFSEAFFRPMFYVRFLVENLQFPSLTEYRFSRYSPPEAEVIIAEINAQKGLLAFMEDGDSIIVYIDRDDFNLQQAIEGISWKCDLY